MIEARTGLFGEVRSGRWIDAFDQGRDKVLRAGRKSDVERAAAAVMTGTVGTDGDSGSVGFAAAVLGHADGHLGADGHEHDERQRAKQKGHSEGFRV